MSDAFGDYARLKAAVPEYHRSQGRPVSPRISERLKMGIEAFPPIRCCLKSTDPTVTKPSPPPCSPSTTDTHIRLPARSGESLDDFSADLKPWAIGAQQMKWALPCAAGVNAKFNRLMRIESELFPS